MEIINRNNDAETKTWHKHKCGSSCLGPLTFHHKAVGDMVLLSYGCRQANRPKNTFKNGLVFSSRPVRVQERIRLWVEEDVARWQGAMRLGFTNVPPEARTLPLPCLSMPDLVQTPGHWVAPLHEASCRAGAEVQFWVSHSGKVYFLDQKKRRHELLKGVDLSRPLWAVIDIYGQTCSIILLGSEKRGRISIRRACMSLASTDFLSLLNMEPAADREEPMTCVVCLSQQANVTLLCGHRCMCPTCADGVFKQFGTCPLCRRSMKGPSLAWRQVIPECQKNKATESQ
ncbi:E3 ubiquitin-protein ligase NEURL3 [Nerophis lumbriciformis]|uniref:E3 ubiquitin-protein ligase NEURL3 n=1 Tax=Nerophis lumbriciformis TaxID=546530 RepID=UPI002ADF4DD3|nr:E3 ubiquitin-protein ligase NEURL3-like [Nerophis lumbriciformis]